MRILLGMSGGVDSAYSALELMNAGHGVEGAVLLMHGYTEVEAAKRCADSIGIPLHVIDCREVFFETVVENFMSEYLAGRTPNPCILCNREVKFRYLYEYAKANGFDKIATGHYAKIVKIGNRYAVSRGRDGRKDQSYMLYRLPQHILADTVFPLAEEEKKNVKDSSRRHGISAADRRESQEICFIPSGEYAEYIEARRGKSQHGSYINAGGEILGEHKGIIRYTVGQRKGLGISLGERVFVSAINSADNTVTLSNTPSRSESIDISDMVFSGLEELRTGERRCFFVKIRYLAPPVKCDFLYLGGGKGRIFFAEPQLSVTPGQSAVLYDGDTVMAGGIIGNTSVLENIASSGK
jgi:tRNA-specific 2-thiouridylase